MGFEIRTVEPDELESYVRAVGVGFGEHTPGDEVSSMVEGLRTGTCRGAFDDGSVVATSLDTHTSMMLPGGVDAPVVAITWVTTLPTHRRRGAMRGLMDATLKDARVAGIDRAALWVSEVGIYGRFGFGPATLAYTRIEVDTVYGAFARPHADTGRIRFLDPADARSLLPGVYERARAGCAGDVLRTADYWQVLLNGKRMAERFVVLHEDAARAADGFAIYRCDRRWSHGVPETVVECDDLVWCNRDAHAALWRYLLDLDLVKTV
jgi:predicted acetyltransferase